jgi:Sulfotransferase domain
MHDFISWNLSRAGRRMMRADAFFVSVPKSGRTWVRVFYYAYLSNLAGREFSWNAADFPNYPNVVFTHDRWEHQIMPGWWNFIRGKYLVPPQARCEKKIILMVRDPRDIMVSLYFHFLKRPHSFKWKPQPLSKMLRDPKFGIAPTIRLMNDWLAEWQGKENFKLMRYRDCRADTTQHFKGLLEFLDLAPLNDTAFMHALEISRFENMQAKEASGEFEQAELSAGDPADKDSFKARKGKVAGFADHFSDKDLAYTTEEMKKLDPRFGYVP